MAYVYSQPSSDYSSDYKSPTLERSQSLEIENNENLAAEFDRVFGKNEYN
jgi:hypothetical protein